MNMPSIKLLCYFKLFKERFPKSFKDRLHCQLVIFMHGSPLLELNSGLEQSLCGGSGLKLWLYSSESGGN